jgi:Sigma-54 interaction domain
VWLEKDLALGQQWQFESHVSRDVLMPRVLVIETSDAAQALIESRFDGCLSIESATTVKAGLHNHHRNPFQLIVRDIVSSSSECFSPVPDPKEVSQEPHGYQNDHTFRYLGGPRLVTHSVCDAIHKRSRRKHFPYVPVNMGAMASELIASELFGHEPGAYTRVV